MRVIYNNLQSTGNQLWYDMINAYPDWDLMGFSEKVLYGLSSTNPFPQAISNITITPPTSYSYDETIAQSSYFADCLMLYAQTKNVNTTEAYGIGLLIKLHTNLTVLSSQIVSIGVPAGAPDAVYAALIVDLKNTIGQTFRIIVTEMGEGATYNNAVNKTNITNLLTTYGRTYPTILCGTLNTAFSYTSTIADSCGFAILPNCATITNATQTTTTNITCVDYFLYNGIKNTYFNIWSPAITAYKCLIGDFDIVIDKSQGVLAPLAYPTTIPVGTVNNIMYTDTLS